MYGRTEASVELTDIALATDGVAYSNPEADVQMFRGPSHDDPHPPTRGLARFNHAHSLIWPDPRPSSDELVVVIARIHNDHPAGESTIRSTRQLIAAFERIHRLPQLC